MTRAQGPRSMTFTSVSFLVFLVVVFSLYWAVGGRTVQNRLLLAAGVVFYGWWDWRFCGLMLLSGLGDWGLGLLVSATERPTARKVLVGMSVAVNLALLGFFKYFNFFQENLTGVLGSLGWRVDPWTLQVILPVGISFYTFQSMGYIIDVYRRQVHAVRNPLDYLAYVTFFPQLMAGAIERAGNLLPQFLNPRLFHRDAAVDGCRQILWGFVKKRLLADQLAVYVDAVYNHAGEASRGQLLLATVFFAFQIYCDFSAYSDIALGAARLLGFRLMRNFAYPYFSQDLTEFWRRWHISLSSWFRDYVYFPLGGSRGGLFNASRNIFVVFLISGLWHGASWNFVVWGTLHGLGVIGCTLWASRRGKAAARSEDAPGGPGWLPSLGEAARMLATFAVVNLAWIFFRARTLGEAWFILKAIFTPGPTPGGGRTSSFPDCRPSRCCCSLGGWPPREWVQRRQPHVLTVGQFPRPIRWAVYTALVWAVVLCSTESSPFIYFQF